MQMHNNGDKFRWYRVTKNILKFGYGTNYKYVGTLSYSFDRFYVVTKFKLPKVQDLQFTTIPYDKRCNHLDDAKSKGVTH